MHAVRGLELVPRHALRARHRAQPVLARRLPPPLVDGLPGAGGHAPELALFVAVQS